MQTCHSVLRQLYRNNPTRTPGYRPPEVWFVACACVCIYTVCILQYVYISCIKYVCAPVMCRVWYRECKGEKICTHVKTVTSSQDLKRRRAKSLGRHSGRRYTVDHRAILKAYPKVPHLRLVNALCMECAHWGMCVLGYFLFLSAISAISAVLKIRLAPVPLAPPLLIF